MFSMARFLLAYPHTSSSSSHLLLLPSLPPLLFLPDE